MEYGSARNQGDLIWTQDITPSLIKTAPKIGDPRLACVCVCAFITDPEMPVSVVCVCLCVYIHACIHICICTCRHICRGCIHVYICICMYRQVPMYPNREVHTHMYAEALAVNLTPCAGVGVDVHTCGHA